MKIMSIAGARPNFMKLAAIAAAIEKLNNSKLESDQSIEHVIVHTGQHYDAKMSDSFFVDLGIPQPTVNLEVGSSSHAAQTAEIMRRFEPVLLDYLPDILLVVGDVNSTIACTLVASKIMYPVNNERTRPIIVHVEAGLRSFDRDMPEEVNRVLTDALSDHLFVTEQSGVDNLLAEGVPESKIHFVGNVMIDTLISHLERAEQSNVLEKIGVTVDDFLLVTLHRPSNVDNVETLKPLIDSLVKVSERIKIVFPVHPRTKNSLVNLGLWQALEQNEAICLTEPFGYLDFLKLIKESQLVLTDSGGLQEETTYLKVPCITLRNNTERPVTVTVGSNYLIGTDPKALLTTADSVLTGNVKNAGIPEYWDGRAGERIINILRKCV